LIIDGRDLLWMILFNDRIDLLSEVLLLILLTLPVELGDV
jgi:hypothetical protein